MLLVGHSSGALAAQAFAFVYPDDCAGLVLVDGSHELGFRAGPARIRKVNRALAVLAAEVGLLSLFAPTVRRIAVRWMSVRGGDPLTARERRLRYRSRPSAHRILDGWLGHAPLQAALLQWQLRGPPQAPVRVVAGTARVERRGTDRRWATVQRDLAVRMGDPGPVLLADAAHLVPLDRPDVVADAVREFLAADEVPGETSTSARDGREAR